MLAMSDTRIDDFLPIFANSGVPVTFLVPTPTGFEKSIMDATAPVRNYLHEMNIHDYSIQLQGPDYKVILPTFFVTDTELIETTVSLYRPVTKKGDPRIWFGKLKRYCSPCNLLAIISIDKILYVINLSNNKIKESLLCGGFVYDVLKEAEHKENSIAEELLAKLKVIHNRGFIPSITPGDSGVGDTLENALGISRNNSPTPDYKGIELKSTRLTRNGENRNKTRNTLFTRVPDEGMSYREIVDNYGKIQIPRGSTEARLQLYETLRASRKNAYDLLIQVQPKDDKLLLIHQDNSGSEIIEHYVSAWLMKNLREQLLIKHRETFWVKALSENINGIEHFRYDRVLHTKKPNASLLAPLFETDKITIDLAAHYKPDGKWRNHGVLFKMNPDDIPMLMGNPIEYIL
ncbi:MAG: MvaI/BcnI family restriction endonuclease [Saccharofermentans sp.]|nr:MvaI/BcnI family restriction endonuclease [Saccharofermentans sp.]